MDGSLRLTDYLLQMYLVSLYLPKLGHFMNGGPR